MRFWVVRTYKISRHRSAGTERTINLLIAGDHPDCMSLSPGEGSARRAADLSSDAQGDSHEPAIAKPPSRVGHRCRCSRQGPPGDIPPGAQVTGAKALIVFCRSDMSILSRGKCGYMPLDCPRCQEAAGSGRYGSTRSRSSSRPREAPQTPQPSPSRVMIMFSDWSSRSRKKTASSIGISRGDPSMI